MDPRISFSNDFADVGIKYENNYYREAPVSSSEFEFSVKNYAMIPADEIFFKGVLLPLKGDNEHGRKLTLRDTLLVDDGDNGGGSFRRKGSGWWKERLGLKKANVVSKKRERNEGKGSAIEALER
ncbi:hypothetical protein E1A91_D02G249100v1 [Gossypium mustelinum]|uniref:Uncharacterized protein n=2 Tax=Gossypium TaxID=3633 RepID=A0A5D2W0B4_GOSMU|nr:hypothetical protein GOBAR_DD24472 [Gossypium barbadense]TYH85398.1 hypothetical protein ES332_D02G263900v1 [Gossypium tomentosum]TYI95035.1 hypothetical protein E1A91_D02G249100v1 [Gossypium mustelinum]